MYSSKNGKQMIKDGQPGSQFWGHDANFPFFHLAKKLDEFAV
jgi:hypothetical protein